MSDDTDLSAEIAVLRWQYGHRLLSDPTATTPAGNLRHGVLEVLTGESRSRGGKRRNTRPPALSEELIRDLALIEARIQALSRRRSADHGHVYVIEFSSGVVKVGKAANPDSRLASHDLHARIHGVQVTKSWASDRHSGYAKTERRLIKYCARLGVRIADGNEYFTDISFEAARDFAAQLVAERTGEKGIAI
jgi:hypothetical protein